MLIFLHMPVSGNEEIYLFKMTCLKISQILCKKNPLWVGFHLARLQSHYEQVVSRYSFDIPRKEEKMNQPWEKKCNTILQNCQPNIYRIPFDVTFSKFSIILLISWYVTCWKYNLMLTVNFILKSFLFSGIIVNSVMALVD